METNERQDVIINVNAAVTVLFAKFIELNFDGLTQLAKDSISLTDVGVEEFKHITQELFYKSLAVAVPS